MATFRHVIRAAASPVPSIVDGVLAITNTYLNTFQPINYANIDGLVTKTAYNAETAQVSTITFTAVASTEYGLMISQNVQANGDNGRPEEVRVLKYTSKASGDTATTIGDAFRAQLAVGSRLQITATGTTTLILTANAGYPIFSVQALNANASIAIAATTAGVKANGKGADLIAAGFDNCVSGQTYTVYSFKYKRDTGPKNEQALPVYDNVFIALDTTVTPSPTIDAVLDGTYIDSTSTATIKSTLGAYVTKL